MNPQGTTCGQQTRSVDDESGDDEEIGQCSRPTISFGDDVDGDVELHVRMGFGDHRVLTDRLDVIG